jgi:outer membrane lipoprotein-sorting protein
LYNYDKKGYKVDLAGRENVNNVNAYKLVVTDKTNNATTYYFDPTSYYMIKASKTIPAGEVSTIFSDYRKTDYGYLIPYSVETALPQGFSVTATINTVEINKDIDPGIFEMPKS